MMNWKGFGRKRLRPNKDISLEELKETSPLLEAACVQGKICTKHFSIQFLSIRKACWMTCCINCTDLNFKRAAKISECEVEQMVVKMALPTSVHCPQTCILVLKKRIFPNVSELTGEDSYTL
jgi:hypothetical protein